MVNNDLSRLQVLPTGTYAINHLAVNSGKYCKDSGDNTLLLHISEHSIMCSRAYFGSAHTSRTQNRSPAPNEKSLSCICPWFSCFRNFPECFPRTENTITEV